MLIPKTSRLLAVLCGLFLTAILLLAQSGFLPTFTRLYERFELLAYDLRMQWHLPSEVAPAAASIVIVDIDEASLGVEGRWPWSRARIADLVMALHEAGAAVVAFDVLFGEPERNPAVEVLAGLEGQDVAELQQQLKALLPRYDADLRLAEALQQAEVVLGYVFHHQESSGTGQLPESLQLAEMDPARLVLPQLPGYAAPLAVLMDQAAGAGFFSLAPDADGVVRRAPMLARREDQLYPSLSLQTLRQFMFLEEVALRTARIADQDHIEQILLDNALALPTDSSGQLLIPYRGPAGSFPYLPAWEVLAGITDPDLLEGAIVLVGTSAPGLFDLRSTPVDAVYPGVEVHANLLAAMLDQQFLQQPSWAPGANLLITLAAGLLLGLLLPWLNPVWQLLSGLMVAGVLLGWVSWLWVELGVVLALAGPLFMVLVLSTFNFVWGFFYEFMTHHRLANMFGQYVPPQLVEEMSRHPAAFNFDGESREMSVLFSDIRGFTTLSESLAADELKRLLNRYFTPITGIIFDHRGTIDKYIGDLVMAFWGAPVRDTEHARHSIEAAMDMLQATERLSAEFVAEGLPAISVGVGINSGVMNVGDMGSTYRRAYTVLGDAVNLASRLEGTTKYYGVSLVVGERTRELALEHFVWRELDLVKVKGKMHPVRVYQPVCPVAQATPELEQELQQLDQALRLFRSKELDQAELAFSALQQQHPKAHQYVLYLERISQLRSDPPAEDWDGSWVRTEK